jgi:PAS domain S-box-containing protein
MKSWHYNHDSAYQNNQEAATSTLQRTETATTSPLPQVSMTEVMTLLNFSPDALLVIDQTGTVVLINEQVTTLFEYHPSELIGLPLEMLLPERFRLQHTAHRTHYFAQPRLRPMGVGLNLMGCRKDGSEFPVEISLRPLLLEQRLHVVAAIRDIHALKEAEYLKDEFIGIAAHELRLPLAVLKGAVGTLLLQTARGHGPPLADWQEEMLRDLEQATDRLTSLTENLLDISRLQAGRFFLQCASTNVVSLVRRVVEHLQQTTTRHHLRVHNTQTMLQAFIDPRRIEQVLTNLLSNAIKYCPSGGPIDVSVINEAASHLIEIRVQDRGMGIPRHQQAHIFGRFIRAENAQSAGISGTGLGLYLCKALVEQHEGQIWFTSAEGEGTTFFLTLPLVALAHPECGLLPDNADADQAPSSIDTNGF